MQINLLLHGCVVRGTFLSPLLLSLPLLGLRHWQGPNKLLCPRSPHVAVFSTRNRVGLRYREATHPSRAVTSGSILGTKAQNQHCMFSMRGQHHHPASHIHKYLNYFLITIL
ncbi:hypothetical protein F4860DRAFT_477648 [Xylaria cubensis]|nr:hypothetical protein F4860DRAFT_477648 [Xylaria cubensis]